VIGAQAAQVGPDIPRPLRTRIYHGAHIGSQAVILAGLEVGEESFVNAHSLVAGDLHAHCLAEGDPAALRGFICPCGGITEVRIERRVAVQYTFLCTVCRQPVTVPGFLIPQINHVLRPGGQLATCSISRIGSRRAIRKNNKLTDRATNLETEHWDKIIQPQRSLFDLRLGELWKYRDLVMLFVRLDFRGCN